jgi:2-hydroxy-6-oxonona-2,4-dienedioate hydrolase
MTNHRYNIRTVQIKCSEISFVDEGEGSPVLYLHGAGGRPPAAATFVHELAAHHRVLLPSRPGFDESPLGSCESERDVAEALAEFIESVASCPVNVVAQSAGGTAALWLAILHPELVQTLVLSAPSVFATRHESRGQRSQEELDALLYGSSPSWHGSLSLEDQARIRQNAAGNMGRSQSQAQSEELLARLKEISMPVLVLWGTEDHMLSPDSSGFYQKHIPHAVRMMIYGAAHELPIAATRQWATLVSDFVQRGEFFVVNNGSVEAR